MRYRVLVTDYVWPTLDRERAILEPLGVELVPSPSGDEEALVQLAAGVDGIMTCFANVTPAVVRASNKLRVIARYGIGVDNIAVDVATSRDVVVTNVPDYCVEEVAEHALALLFASARKLTRYDREVRSDNWNSKVGMPLYRIQGKTLGIVGFGQIGRKVAAKAQALGLHVIAHSPRLTPAEAHEAGCRAVDLPELLQTADFVSLHLPLNPQTMHMFDRGQFDLMKPGAIFINTSRGGLVDSAALAGALASGRVAAAGIDVLPQEPPDADEFTSQSGESHHYPPRRVLQRGIARGTPKPDGTRSCTGTAGTYAGKCRQSGGLGTSGTAVTWEFMSLVRRMRNGDV